jgi:hypothetical protein
LHNTEQLSHIDAPHHIRVRDVVTCRGTLQQTELYVGAAIPTDECDCSALCRRERNADTVGDTRGHRSADARTAQAVIAADAAWLDAKVKVESTVQRRRRARPPAAAS